MRNFIDELAEDVRMQVPAASNPMIERVLKRTARAFYLDTWAWREDLEDESLEAESTQQAVSIPANTTLVGFSTLYTDSGRLAPATPRQLAAMWADYATRSGSPVAYRLDQSDTGSFLVYLQPTAEVPLYGQAVVAPTLRATQMPDRLLDLHGEILLNGALGLLFAMPHDWHSRVLAETHLKLFEYAKSHVKSSADDGNVTGVARRVRYGGY